MTIRIVRLGTKRTRGEGPARRDGETSTAGRTKKRICIAKLV